MGKQSKQWQTLYSWVPESLQMVTAAMKLRHLLLERKGAYYQPRSYYHMTNLDSILKSRDITLPTKVHLVKAMVFPVVMYGCESWTIKKAERWRIDAFELWCFDWCWCWNSNTLATRCKELTHWKTPWCWERLKAGGEGDDRGWDGWMASPTQWTWIWVNSGSWWWTGKPGMLQSMGWEPVGHDWVIELNAYTQNLERW